MHDFGFRGVSSHESAGIGGMAHLVNFKGTDTVPAMEFAMAFYNAPIDGLAYSVAATEHSIMTACGKDGEVEVVNQLLNEYPTGILSVVSDSYDIYNFVDNVLGKTFKDRILKREGIFVVRPDSVTPDHPTPEDEMVWLAENLFKNFGGTINTKGYKVINPKIRLLWGDGIEIEGIEKILDKLDVAGFAAENVACFGMGGGLLQKINRDTMRFAFKSSAQKRGSQWFDVFKNPKDESKASKKGKLKLVRVEGAHGKAFTTVKESDEGVDALVTVFENGNLVKEYTFEEVRNNAEL
jgi:nicotinamide phosphoribosyltransferase